MSELHISARILFSGYKLFGLYAAVTSVAFYFMKSQFIRRKLIQLELQDAHNALEPLLLAENDRLYLKQLKKNREEERELMKNVPGWVVGTYFGEPIYSTLSPNTHMDPIPEEYFAHTDPKISDYNWHYWDHNF
uniref:NADH dehydrogenase [ubiquinone] 1 alpha subcomplex subunit 13 n=1 Tax=Amblyomma triste TaxID=251400 RepID=A0A023G644_AMBTT